MRLRRGVEGEEPTLHRPEVVEPPDIFQRSGGKRSQTQRKG